MFKALKWGCSLSPLSWVYVLMGATTEASAECWIWLCGRRNTNSSNFFFNVAYGGFQAFSLGVELELHFLVTATAIATPDSSRVWDLHHSSRQHWILNSLSRVRDRTLSLKDTSQVHFHWATAGTLLMCFNKKLFAVVWVTGESIREIFLRKWDLGMDLEKWVGCF